MSAFLAKDGEVEVHCTDNLVLYGLVVRLLGSHPISIDTISNLWL